MKITAFAACFALFVGSAQAQTYPERPINMIIAYGAGGGTDLLAHMIAPFIEST